VISYLVYALSIHVFHLLSSVALIVGYLAGMVTSYSINSRWTFEKDVFSWRYFWRFLVVNLIILVFSECTLWLILKFLVSSKYMAQGINTVPTLIVGFLANRLVVFKEKDQLL
jgi:putative flippase GtrA